MTPPRSTPRSPLGHVSGRDAALRSAKIALAMGLAMGLATGVAPALAADPEVDSAPTSLNLVVENDKFIPGATDRHFTNGLRLSWVSPVEAFPAWTRPLSHLIDLLAPDHGLARARWVGGAIGQNMYTPEDISRTDPIPDDRPYAGWLYGGLILTERRGDRRIDEIEIDLGVIGPGSLADETQINWHKVINSPRPNGWENQLKTEPGLVFLYRTKWRAALWQSPPLGALSAEGLELDIIPGANLSLGNIFTYAGGEVTLRLGDDLADDFGTHRIQPNLAGSSVLQPQDGFAWYLFAGAGARAVGHNIFLDGNTVSDSLNVNKNFLVADYQAGLAVRIYGVRLTYTHVWRSREFDTQTAGDRFGSFAISWNF
ncbi:MAG: lipid A deacylase LpxR family protein [Alphaproteobacteria bacterium]